MYGFERVENLKLFIIDVLSKYYCPTHWLNLLEMNTSWLGIRILCPSGATSMLE